MVESVTVQLIFYGLMAFIPNDASPTSLRVLLLDTQGHHYSSDGCKLPRHVPALYVQAEKCAVSDGRFPDDEAVPCRFSKEIAPPVDPKAASGSWPLNGEDLFLEIEIPDGHKKKLVLQRSAINTPLPADPKQATDLAWIPSLPGKIDRNCLGAADDCPVAARFEIDDGEVTSCLLLDQSSNLVPAFELRPLGAPAGLKGAPAQAITGAVLASLTVPKGAKIRVVSRSLADTCRGREISKRVIVLEAKDRPKITLWLTNIPYLHSEPGAHHDACHDPKIDRHYEMYYSLLDHPVPFSKRAVPHSLGAAVSRRFAEAQPPAAKKCKPLDLAVNDFFPGNWLACGNVWLQPPPNS